MNYIHFVNLLAALSLVFVACDDGNSATQADEPSPSLETEGVAKTCIDLIVTIKDARGSTDTKTYSMYNMESEVGVEMAYSAAKATCRDGGGNDRTTKVCS